MQRHAHLYLALAACLAAPLFAAQSARADTLACSALSTQAGSSHAVAPLQIQKVEQLERVQDRPYQRIPTGVALWVRAPRGLTTADLHNLIGDCQKQGQDDGSVLCVKGASISVDRQGGNYVVSVTSTDRTTALEIQRRAAARK